MPRAPLVSWTWTRTMRDYPAFGALAAGVGTPCCALPFASCRMCVGVFVALSTFTRTYTPLVFAGRCYACLHSPVASLMVAS
jgi:hypothetical protein